MLGYVFRTCLPPIPDGHFNLRDVTRFSADIIRKGKAAGTSRLVVTTAEGEVAFSVSMSAETGHRIMAWMNAYFERRRRIRRLLHQTNSQRTQQQRENANENIHVQRENNQIHVDNNQIETENNPPYTYNTRIQIDNTHLQNQSIQSETVHNQQQNQNNQIHINNYQIQIDNNPVQVDRNQINLHSI